MVAYLKAPAQVKSLQSSEPSEVSNAGVRQRLTLANVQPLQAGEVRQIRHHPVLNLHNKNDILSER
jgi:hypothetical protein